MTSSSVFSIKKTRVRRNRHRDHSFEAEPTGFHQQMHIEDEEAIKIQPMILNFGFVGKNAYREE